MASTKTKPNKADFMKAETPAKAAEILGHSDGGKRLRARLRSLGVKVSENRSDFNRAAKEKLWAIFAEGKQVAKTKKQTSGGNAKQRRSRKRKETAEATPTE